MKKRILSFISVLFILILTTTRVFAMDITLAGDTVVQEGEYDSIRLVAGNKVTNKANIDGLSLMAGNEVVVEGNSTYGFYAGNNIIVNGGTSKDLFVAGNKITIDMGATIGRDVFVVGNSVTVMTNIARDIRLGADSVDLSGITINGDAYLMADKIILDENTIINGTLTYPEDANVTGLDAAQIGKIVTTAHKEIAVKVNFTSSVMDFIFSVCASFVVMLVLFYLLPKTKDKLDKLELKVDTVFKTMGIGFLVLIVVPIVTIIALFTSILTPLALILGCIYVIAIYLSSLLPSYIIGSILAKKLFNNDSKYIALAIGIILVKLVKLIPVVGPFISFICLLYGLGLIFNYIKNRNK